MGQFQPYRGSGYGNPRPRSQLFIATTHNRQLVATVPRIAPLLDLPLGDLKAYLAYNIGVTI